VAETGAPKGKAKYGPHDKINEATIHRIEVDAVKRGLEESEYELPEQKENVRSFWAECSKEVGASSGEKTKFIYVEYQNDGTVHGRPMTKQELIDKGMKE
jgi:hypothetical protein